MADNTLDLSVSDMRVFVPALDFQLSLRFYQALGWELKWKGDDDGLAILELADHRFFLQNFYRPELADNFMFQVLVSDAQAWYEHVSKILEEGDFGKARLRPPKLEDYGAITLHVLDPSGVLIHFSQFVTD
ncbi:MAG: hypothetical protein CL607_08755 [Anaerolineaceae bacterium]|nr:hypothetical protein [Anaerolineaceae bacterium]